MAGVPVNPYHQAVGMLGGDLGYGQMARVALMQQKLQQQEQYQAQMLALRDMLQRAQAGHAQAQTANEEEKLGESQFAFDTARTVGDQMKGRSLMDTLASGAGPTQEGATLASLLGNVGTLTAIKSPQSLLQLHNLNPGQVGVDPLGRRVAGPPKPLVLGQGEVGYPDPSKPESMLFGLDKPFMHNVPQGAIAVDAAGTTKATGLPPKNPGEHLLNSLPGIINAITGDKLYGLSDEQVAGLQQSVYPYMTNALSYASDQLQQKKGVGNEATVQTNRPNTYQSPEEVRADVQAGKLDKATALGILRQQFNFK